MATTFGRPGLDWTVVLRRRPARIVAGQAEGGYTDMFEIICCDCRDDPDLDYREISPRLQRIRGPYPIGAGIAAYERHLQGHPNRQPAHRPGRRAADGGRTDLLSSPGRTSSGGMPPGQPGNVPRRKGVRDHGKPRH